MMQEKIQNNKGYTLLFAVLVSSIVLSVGISILTISKKEFLLSSSARESISAFYAADSGLECALYQVDNDLLPISGTNFSINCMGASRTGTLTIAEVTSGKQYTYIFQTNMQENANACAKVSIRVEPHPTEPVPQTLTTINSWGYNLGWDASKIGTSVGQCSDSSPRRVERAIEYTY